MLACKSLVWFFGGRGLKFPEIIVNLQVFHIICLSCRVALVPGSSNPLTNTHQYSAVILEVAGDVNDDKENDKHADNDSNNGTS